MPTPEPIQPHKLAEHRISINGLSDLSGVGRQELSKILKEDDERDEGGTKARLIPLGHGVKKLVRHYREATVGQEAAARMRRDHANAAKAEWELELKRREWIPVCDVLDEWESLAAAIKGEITSMPEDSQERITRQMLEILTRLGVK